MQKKVRDAIIALHKTFRPDDVKSTAMGSSGEDVQLSPFVRDRVPISVECKSYAKFAVYKHFDQAKTNTPKGSEPILVIKQNRSNPLVVCDMDHYFELRRKLLEYEDED